MRALERNIYQLVEQEREKIDPHAKPLKLDPELSAIARMRSRDMAATHHMAHESPDGETSAKLIMAADPNFQGVLGENIAAQYFTTRRGINVVTFAKRFVDTWLASKSHRDNLAFPAYDHTGVGAAVSGTTIYVTQLFSSTLGLKPPRQNAQRRPVTDHRTVPAYSAPPKAKTQDPLQQGRRLHDAIGIAGDSGDGQ